MATASVLPVTRCCPGTRFKTATLLADGIILRAGGLTIVDRSAMDVTSLAVVNNGSLGKHLMPSTARDTLTDCFA